MLTAVYHNFIKILKLFIIDSKMTKILSNCIAVGTQIELYILCEFLTVE